MTTNANHPYSQPKLLPVGTHWIADLSGVASALLTEADPLMDCMRNALRDCGVKILAERTHQFPGGGFTGFFLLSESHAAIHTYPESGYAAIDLFTCGTADGKHVIDAVVAVCAPHSANVRTFERSRTEFAQK